MFVQDRGTLMASIAKMGAAACSYTWGEDADVKWADPDHRCDCKFGGPSIRPTAYAGEKTGCPELHSVYAVLNALTDEQYLDWFTARATSYRGSSR